MSVMEKFNWNMDLHYMKYAAVFLIAILLLSGCVKKEGRTVAIIKTNMGTIKAELYTKEAPITTENFIKLAKDGFYNGMVFHRVIDNFVIQAGAFYPNGTYKQSPYGTIPLEVKKNLTHVDGALGMARARDPNSASSQFYICDGPQHELDGNYTVFGRVIDGMNVVREIASVKTTTKYGMPNWPVNDVIIETITIKVE